MLSSVVNVLLPHLVTFTLGVFFPNGLEFRIHCCYDVGGLAFSL